MGFPISLPSDRSNVNRLLPKSVSCFDKPVLSEPFTLREPQGERFFPNVLSEVEGRAQHDRKSYMISTYHRSS